MKKMKTQMRNFAVSLAAILTSVSAFAFIPEGNWTDGWEYFYVNSRYHYCSADYNRDARRLSWQQEQELRSYTYDGTCESREKGPKNYRGRSYYFNGEGAYCQYRYYKHNLEEMSSSQANWLFDSNRFDGYCVE
jgi:hypothetical protein